MAKKSMIARDVKRAKLVKKYAARRAELKRQVIDPSLSMAERMEASQKLAKLPRDSSPVRGRRRGAITGRPKGTYRKFGLGRIKARELVLRGEAPGVSKASW